MRSPFELLPWARGGKDDPVLRLAKWIGFEVLYYTPKQAPWERFPNEVRNLSIYLTLIVGFLYINRGSTGLVRQFAGVTSILTMISYPALYGRSGLLLFDFGIPAYAFLTTLHLTDIFLVRTAEDTKDWSYVQMYAEALTFPKEEQSDWPRWENIKVLGLCFVKYIAVNILLYAAPNEDIIKTVKNPFAWVMYHAVIGACILNTLGFLIEGTMRVMGVIIGVEQNYLFQNPLGSPNLRLFWARWNMVIKEGLHRVIFRQKEKEKAQAKQQNGSADPSKAGKPAARPQQKARRYSHKDHLSETEMSSSAAPSDSDMRRQAVVEARKEKKKKGKFLPKAAAAFITFAFSGIFHEYMNHLAFDGASGETVLFFLTHAMLVIAYVWLSRNLPSVCKAVPTPLAILLTNVFAFGTSPLFCRPFVRAAFFDQLKNYGLISGGPIQGFVYFCGR